MDTLFVWADSEHEGYINSSYHRVFTPAKYLNRAGVPVRTVRYHEYAPELFPARTLLLERILEPGLILRARRAGAQRIVATFDDAYRYIPADGLTKRFWDKHHDQFVAALGMVDEVIVPSRRLVAEYGPACKRITVVPNFLDDDLWQMSRKVHTDTGRVVIGYGGSFYHFVSWESGAPAAALRKLQQKYDVEVEIYGSAGRNALAAAGVAFRPRAYVTFQNWPTVVSGWDIGLAPLHGLYDSFRSTLKAQEYGAAWVPWVGTSSDVYYDAQGGIMAENTAAEWFDALESLMSPSARQRLADEGAAWSQSLYMSRNVGVYADILRLERKNA